ncbi:hypothetical protein ANN_09460 [Periplaneta americana]|uniref:DUF4817 domain-containing protein n=1 Tax=Periplaneta americana TaxID=6978 RepID=A0ABQ8TNL3_PERAM|nr:hypothetical protein ANN_09460 [Periplaneta americana]
MGKGHGHYDEMKRNELKHLKCGCGEERCLISPQNSELEITVSVETSCGNQHESGSHVSQGRYSFHEQADIIFMYGRANGNGREAVRLYQMAFPDRRQPNHQTFVAVYRRVAETGTVAPQTGDRGRPRVVRMPNLEEDILHCVEDDPVSEDRNVVIAGDLNLPKINWNGISGTNSDAQTLVNELIWRKDFTQVVNGPTRDNALLDVYLLRPVSLFVNSESLHKISDYNSVLLEIFWENTVNPRSSPLSVWNFNKTNVHELQTFLRQKHDDFLRTEGNMENVWHKFKSIIFEALVKCVPSKIIKKNPDPEYYTNYIRYLKKKTRRVFSKRKRSHDHWEKYVELIKKLECEKG